MLSQARIGVYSCPAFVAARADDICEIGSAVALSGNRRS
jgi:hypothetical protein